ncbi:uncharacterized protein UTRI_06543_B [Ustilago trichophora]|uniref:Uncharacterized protein n=1 Tax=Ustilago trichophora TaxID=86804 RepID=A0A5C3ER16_9BASI|nr:uncharacterized protein UTRI_06543_B [Ustilago trichophora]
MKFNIFFVALALSSSSLSLAAPLPLGGFGSMFGRVARAGRNGESSAGFVPHETYPYQREGEEDRRGFHTATLYTGFVPHETYTLQGEGEEGRGGFQTVPLQQYPIPPRRPTRYQSPLPGSREGSTLHPLSPNRPRYPTHSDAVRGEDILGPRPNEEIHHASHESFGSRRSTSP